MREKGPHDACVQDALQGAATARGDCRTPSTFRLLLWPAWCILPALTGCRQVRRVSTHPLGPGLDPVKRRPRNADRGACKLSRRAPEFPCPRAREPRFALPGGAPDSGGNSAPRMLGDMTCH